MFKKLNSFFYMFYIPRIDLETPATKTFEWCDLKLFTTFLIWDASHKINETTRDPSGGGCGGELLAYKSFRGNLDNIK